MSAFSICVAYGDGDSPELMEAALLVLREAGAPLNIESIEIGKRIYDMQHPPGILPSAFDSLARTKILLKGPTIKAVEENYKDVGDVIRERFGLALEHQTSLSLTEDIAATAHINEHFALFEPNAQTAPSMLLACTMLLEHINQAETAARIKNALQEMLEAPLPQKTLFQRLIGSDKSAAMEFADAICTKLNANFSKIAS